MGLLILTKREALIMTSRIEYYDEAQEAFTHALTTKTFNENDDNHFFIGDWMFMGSGEKTHQFKNRYTKDYIYVNKEV